MCVSERRQEVPAEWTYSVSWEYNFCSGVLIECRLKECGGRSYEKARHKRVKNVS